MMKPFAKALVAAGLMTASVTASAGLSANIGAMSDYWFRGLDQTGAGNGASMMAGLDYDQSGFYIGTWAADVSNGLEYDLYAGYEGEVEGIGYGVGVTGYFYTEESFIDGSYEELNLSLSYGPVSVSHNIGTFKDDTAGPDVDYSFTSLTGEYAGGYLTYAVYGDEVDGDYFEVGYGLTYEGLDFGVAAIFPDEDTSAANNWVSSSNTVTLTIGKSFDL